MKALLLLIASVFSAAAMADEPLPVEHYSYSQHLDIAHVISTTDIANVCAVVPMRMTYEDTNGQKHILEYRVMGNGCSNG
ncbi:DUF2790 domain-containing protein [Pseudomonas lundensis]|uniref:DUF2790 domain-containing protein n=1 Tax=Pseudomonas lundensis TaxID=86185 RepID=UPI000642535D|nr:DUF2790 domain-containing protein [Pseudomonas lundensis]